MLDIGYLKYRTNVSYMLVFFIDIKMNVRYWIYKYRTNVYYVSLCLHIFIYGCVCKRKKERVSE